jgi:hypothetical protein
MFYKSMTTHADHRVWQGVHHVSGGSFRRCEAANSIIAPMISKWSRTVIGAGRRNSASRIRRIGYRCEYCLTADDEDGVGLEFEAESPDHPAQFFDRAQGLLVRHITGPAPSVPVPPPVSPPDRCRCAPGNLRSRHPRPGRREKSCGGEPFPDRD